MPAIKTSLVGLLVASFFCNALCSADDKKEASGNWVRGFVREHTSDLIFIKDKNGKGSGFTCRYRGRDVLLTNIHVIAGLEVPHFSRLDDTPVQVGMAATAVGHDVMCFGVDSIPKPLEVMEQIEKEVGIGDEILVIGNTEGADVALPLVGTVLAIGPKLIEIDAAILPGNSGSPIIHRKSGKIIGVATYLLRGKRGPDAEGEKFKVRRFATRLDSIVQWEKVDWTLFRREADQFRKILAFTTELQDILMGLEVRQLGVLLKSSNTSVYSAGERFIRTMKNPSSTKNDVITATQNLADDMKATCRTDVLSARTAFQFDFFRNRIEEEAPIRQGMSQVFDELSSVMGSYR